MGIVHQSPRQTADLDFSTDLRPEPNLPDDIRTALDRAFPLASARLGNPDLVCKVQTLKVKPRANSLERDQFPALEITIAYALRGSSQADRLAKGHGSDTVKVSISFNEPVDALQIVKLGQQGPEIRAYSLLDLIAEKLRALLQQKLRNRYRRQDMYDIAMLADAFPLDRDEKRHLLDVHRRTCAAHNIVPHVDSLEDPELIRRARDQWHTLDLELETVPDFDACLENVQRLYRDLPW